MSEADGQPVVRTWPPGRELADDDCIEMSCPTCQIHWRVQNRLRGFRMRCECQDWLEVPGLPAAADETSQPAAIEAPDRSELPATFSRRTAKLDERGMMQVPGEEGDVIYQKLPLDAPLAPGTIRRASQSNQTRWTNRLLLEFALMMFALLGPQLAVMFLSHGKESELMLPLASLASAILIAAIVAGSGTQGSIGLRRAAPRYWLEVIPAVVGWILIALAYTEMLRQMFPSMETGMEDLTERLGLVASLLVIAVSPAVLEELIFRGMLQGRLVALFGQPLGIFVTAVAFALVHGAPMVLPIHLGIGLYLGILRERSDSLIPGMLVHFFYNGTLVMLTFA